MTKKELDKKFPFSGKDGKCSNCEYTEHCDKILPGFNKPGKCGGPFEKDSKKEKDGKTKNEQVIRLSESQLRQLIKESVEQVLNGGDEFEQLWEEFEDWMDSYNQSDYPTSYTMKDVARHFYELGKKGQTLNEETLGYDLSTPEGRAASEKWMHYIMSQEDPSETAAKEWAYKNGFWDDENIISAFMAGVNYGREVSG